MLNLLKTLHVMVEHCLLRAAMYDCKTHLSHSAVDAINSFAAITSTKAAEATTLTLIFTIKSGLLEQTPLTVVVRFYCEHVPVSERQLLQCLDAALLP